MPSKLVEIITAQDASLRDRSLESVCGPATAQELLDECAALEQFREQCSNLYERVRAIFFLYAIHRFHLPAKQGVNAKGLVPFEGYEDLLERRFPEAITKFLAGMESQGVNDAICSALAAAYHGLAFQTLSD